MMKLVRLSRDSSTVTKMMPQYDALIEQAPDGSVPETGGENALDPNATDARSHI